MVKKHFKETLKFEDGRYQVKWPWKDDNPDLPVNRELALGRLKSNVLRMKNLLVRLSLLTMTNPNQLCDVLLFVCSKMADETNLSSKLPVADRTREV